MSLEEYRAKIDALDREIIRLLNERAKVVLEVGKLKQETNQKVFDPTREFHIFQKIAADNPGPLSDQCLRAIYREVISASYELERKFRVSFLGPEGTFSHLAAYRKFGAGVEYLPETDIRSVFLAVAKGRSDYGVVPVQNSIDGGVTDALDTFMEVDTKICAELNLPITQCLLSNSPKDGVKRVYSKPQALAQCRRWLRENLPGAELIEDASTARAAKRAADEDGAAAVANELAATIYQLEVIERAIEDGPRNVTRFVIISDQDTKPTGNDRTSILFRAKHEPGALCRMLEPLKDRGLNLLWLDYRPSREQHWEYVFFLDVAGHQEDAPVKEALEELASMAIYFSVLGSYPVSVEEEDPAAELLAL